MLLFPLPETTTCRHRLRSRKFGLIPGFQQERDEITLDFSTSRDEITLDFSMDRDEITLDFITRA